jgi:hypothetical protein
MVRTIARESKRSDRSEGRIYFEIPLTDWNEASANSIFWKSGDFSFETYEGHHRIHIRHYDVRFDPEAVLTIIGSAAKAAPKTSPETEDEDEEKGPPVSDELLKQWFAVYRRAYYGPNDTIANAIKSARGMFPGKFVSRDRIRQIAGGRVRGRKPGSSEDE